MIRVARAIGLLLLGVSSASAQDRGVLAIDEEGGRYAFSLRGEADALRMCSSAGCEVVATFSSCLGLGYSSPTRGQDVWTWFEAGTKRSAHRGALDDCERAGGEACAVVDVWCLGASGSVTPSLDAVAVGAPVASVAAVARPGAPPATEEQENLFWQSIMNSTDPAEFGAYLEQFPNGVFRRLAEARLAALGAPGSPAAGAASVWGVATGGDAPPRRPGDVFRDCDVCPEMVVMPGGRALGRYEVTVGEYRAFASATGGVAGDCFGRWWQDPGYPQTDRHPVACVSWDDVQAYVSWLSRTTRLAYRLPTEAEWELAAAGSQPGCHRERTGNRGTCPVGSYSANGTGLSDMVGNLWEWTTDCREGNCDSRVLRGGSWNSDADFLRAGARSRAPTGGRFADLGFRVSRTLD